MKTISPLPARQSRWSIPTDMGRAVVTVTDAESFGGGGLVDILYKDGHIETVSLATFNRHALPVTAGKAV